MNPDPAITIKPYRSIPIVECGEALVLIPEGRFVLTQPHPYMALGAPYGAVSPWMLRQSVLAALERAQDRLEAQRPGWKIKLFDAYRPNAVQAFMVRREFMLLSGGRPPEAVPQPERDDLYIKALRVWAIPSEDPATPPLHSTGGALDCTLCDATDEEIAMGSPIDENSDRSNPDYFADATDAASRAAHANRVFLNSLMRAEGFHRLHSEWWHFSQGDQYWAWAERKESGHTDTCAIYGAAQPPIT